MPSPSPKEAAEQIVGKCWHYPTLTNKNGLNIGNIQHYNQMFYMVSYRLAQPNNAEDNVTSGF